MEVSEVDRQLIKLLQSRKNLSQIELCNGFLDIARNQSDFSGFPVNNFIESLVKVCISKLSKSFRKLDQSDSQDVFMVIEEIIEIFTQDSQTRRPLLTSEGLIGSLLELVVIDCTPFWMKKEVLELLTRVASLKISSECRIGVRNKVSSFLKNCF